MIKKIVLSVAVIGAFITQILFQRSSSTATPPDITTPDVIATTGSYTDGEYTSAVTDAYYGDLQIKTIISNGNISDVIFLKYPNDRPTSIDVNTKALPILRSEAIKTQNGNVDVVSGATETSIAFKSALKTVLATATK